MLNLAPKIVSPLLDLRSRSEIYLFAGPCGHTKAFDYPVAEHRGEIRNVHFRGWDSNTLEMNFVADLSMTPARHSRYAKHSVTSHK